MCRKAGLDISFSLPGAASIRRSPGDDDGRKPGADAENHRAEGFTTELMTPEGTHTHTCSKYIYIYIYTYRYA